MSMLCLLISSILSGQEYQFKIKSIGVEDGLTNRNVTAMFQDRDGFMWFGTRHGLNRYDANRVTTFTKKKGNLIFNNVEWISQDGNDLLWIYGRDPNQNNRVLIQIFDPKTGSSKLLDDFFGIDLPFSQDEVLTFRSSYASRDLWIIVQNKIYRYHPESRGLIELIYSSSENIFEIIAGPKGFWFYEDGKYQLIDPKGKIIRVINKANGLPSGIHGIDKDGEIFFEDKVTSSSGDSIGSTFIHSATTPTERHIDITNKYRIMGINAYQGQYWRNAAGGIGVFNLDGELIHQFDMAYEIFSYPALVYFDRFGNGWANHEGKINMFTLKKSKFKNYLTDISVFGINAYGARGLYLDGNDLYTNGLGLSYKVNLLTGEKEEFGPGAEFYAGGGGDQAKLKRLALIKDRAGNLWYTDEGVRVAKYDIRTKKFTDYGYPQEEIAQNSLSADPIVMKVHWAAHIDRNGKLWIGRFHGLGYMPKNGNTLFNFKNYGEYTELRKAGVYAFHENDEGIWFGTTTGLYLMTFSGEITRRFYTGGTNNDYIPYNTIAHIREDEEGWFWLASRGGGLIRLNPDTGDYEQWTTEDGLSDDIVYASFEDDYGFLWVSSNQGIMRISKSDFSVSTYLQGDGLIHEEFNTGSYLQADDGRIFFGGLDGVTMFHPKDFLEEENDALAIQLVNLEKQQKKTGLYSDATLDLFSDKQITVRPRELGFVLNFSLLDYLDSEFNTFSYQIDGLDASWNYIDQPSIRINALPYGTYTMKLRGQGPQGQWSKEVEIPLIVIRPFYLRWWFYVLSVLTLVLVVLLFIRNRVKKLQKAKITLEYEVEQRTQQIAEQAQELREMDKVKSRFFANVSHELRTPLTLILGPVTNLLRKKGLDQDLKRELVRVQRNGDGMSNLVEEILDLSKLDAKKLTINSHATLVKEYFEVIFNNFLSQANIKGIDYEYAYQGEETLTVLLDQRLTDRIITNLLSNAFKFTDQGGKVNFLVIVEEDRLVIEVSDSGVGISDKDIPHIFDRFFQTKDVNKPVQGGTGIGLAMSKELSQLLNGDLHVQSTIDHGSTFTLTLPKVIHERPEVAREQPALGAVEDESELIEIDTSKTRLLLVEDNIDMQEFIVQVLSDFHTIECAGNGKEGLEMLQQEQLPDIIISDMMMPEMDGLAFLKHVRAMDKTKDIPLLMLTARSAEEDKLEAFTLGVDDYQLKPFSVEELKARLKNLLRNAENRRTADQEQDNLTPVENSLPLKDEWLESLRRSTEESIHRVDFNISTIAETIGLSERQLQRNLKKTTGLTPVVFVKEIRLQMARGYLEKRTYMQVKDVAQAVGFTSTPYFSKQFYERFGKRPSEYLESVESIIS